MGEAVTDDWQERVDAVWDAAADRGEEATVAAIDALVALRPADDPAALFEAASARDFAGRAEEAEPLYRAALAHGLSGQRQAKAIIQLASTLRNLERPAEATELLRDLLEDHPDHELADAARAFIALSLFDEGLPAEALRAALDALARHIPLYSRAVRAYASELEDQ